MRIALHSIANHLYQPKYIALFHYEVVMQTSPYRARWLSTLMHMDRKTFRADLAGKLTQQEKHHEIT